MQAYERNQIHLLRTPAYSPDINVIEMVWADLKNYLRSKCPQTMYHLVECVRKFERKLTPEYCKRYIDLLPRILQTIIDRQGDWSDM